VGYADDGDDGCARLPDGHLLMAAAKPDSAGTEDRLAGRQRDADDPFGFGSAAAVADAVLYEGYLLYPYRRSSAKNRVRWQFGVLAPRTWIEARGPAAESVAGSAESWRQQTECLLEARPGARVHVRLRFLRLRHRSVQVPDPDGGFREVDALDVVGDRHLTFDEAVPHEFDIAVDLDDLAGTGHETELEVPGGQEVEFLHGAGPAGRLVRRCWPVSVKVRLGIADAHAPFRLHRLRLVVENAVSDVAAEVRREEALRRSLVAAHCLVRVHGGAFLSLLDPPAWAFAAAKQCTNLHTFPVLAGDGLARDVVLSSPIIMYDHPQVAPESPGDLFDATEIDEILSLRTLTLTDEEKREARATDPRAAAIVDRVAAIPDEVLARLHGAIRSLGPIAPTDPDAEPVGAESVVGAAPPLPAPSAPWWDPGADMSVCPESDAVRVDGVWIAKGSRVRLRPRDRGSDVHDMFLAGRTARVQAVLLDVDDARHVAVTVEDDPGADLHQWYGRYRYFAPDELVPLDDEEPSP
jgi:hypothetical protein